MVLIGLQLFLLNDAVKDRPIKKVVCLPVNYDITMTQLRTQALHSEYCNKRYHIKVIIVNMAAFKTSSILHRTLPL
jgi:hypothetical protein